jgi:predicted ATPase
LDRPQLARASRPHDRSRGGPAGVAHCDRLGPGPKEVAQIAAAIGREFSYQLLAPIAGRGENDLAVALGRLGDAGLVFCRGTPPAATYLFKHALVRDAAYASLLRRRREELHARTAAVLESDFPDIVEAQPEFLAQRFTEAGLTEQAVAYWQRAGEHAVARSANVEAAAHFGRGIEVWPLDLSAAIVELFLSTILPRRI